MMLRKIQTQNKQSCDGVALIFAITLLLIFSILGASYITYMTIEVQDANFGVHKTRARMLAQAGVNAALSTLSDAIEAGEVQGVLGVTNTLQLPTYDLQQSGSQSIELTQLENRTAKVDITITDESGKVNLNHAPASVLKEILGIDGAKARAITASLPHDKEGAWFVGVEDLLQRGLLSPEKYATIDTSLVTTYTVIDHDSPSAWLNINTAPTEVMAAILGISVADAEQVRIKKPFSDLAAIAVAAGKDPATFNVKPNPANPEALPIDLALESNCFRIQVSATYGPTEESKTFPATTAQLEVVVLFDGADNYEIVHWQPLGKTMAQANLQQESGAHAPEKV